MSDIPSYVVKRKPHQVSRRVALLNRLDIELTERCNNACIHCLINQPEHDAKSQEGEMDTALVQNVLRQAADLGCLRVRFTGGEPLLRADFVELYLFTRRLGMRVTLFTNARLITPELAQLLARIPPGRAVEVTVYGMHAESYDAVAATRGAFTEFWRGVELLQQYSIPLIVKQSVLPPNRHEIAEFEAFASSLPHMEWKPVYAMNFDLRARHDNPAKNRFIKTLRLTPEETLSMQSRNINYVKRMRQYVEKFMGPPGDKLFNCGAGHGICVDAYGKVQMCMGLRDPQTVYDLRPSTDSDLRISPLKYALTEFFPGLNELRATNPDYLQRCACCFIKGLCEQCPAKSWQEHGTLDTPVEYLCEVAHAQARYLGLLGAEEHSWEIEREESRARVARFVIENQNNKPGEHND
jgi:MoaA/NifB/PqqE/SkfB family radical SAM enzyme